jgi:hypothetical protein
MQRILLAAVDAAQEPGVRKLVTDGTVALGAATSPWWIDALGYAYHGVAAVGTLALVFGRLAVLWYDLRKARRAQERA